MKLKTIRILGVMTGTSCDGLDASCIEMKISKGSSSQDRPQWKTLWSNSVAYDGNLRKRVLELQRPAQTFPIRDWLELDRDLGNWYGQTLKQLIQNNQKRPDVIANHGQTLAHFPSGKNQGVTLQLGDASRIAAATDLTVVHQFRKGDLAAGGQGAPLVPLFHQILAKRLRPGKSGIAIHNIGGISNFSYFGPKNLVLAFDTGPGNIWIDAAAQHATSGSSLMDRGGKLAKAGSADPQALKEVLKHPFFVQPPPKSTGRDDFPIEYLFSRTSSNGNDLVATATQITVESIAHSYEEWIINKNLPLREILICGGGAKNPTLIHRLQARLPHVLINALQEKDLDSQFVESQAFAFFGMLSLQGRSLGGSWTGARAFGPPGFIVPGKNWLSVIKKLT